MATATLSKSMLEKAFTGISKIQLAPVGDLTATSFDNADELFTIKDSVKFTQAQPTKTEIKVDQLDSPIAVAYAAGDFSITGSIPSIAKEVLEYFMSVNAAAAPAITGFAQGTAVDLKTLIVSAMVKISNQDGTMAIVIPVCEFIANFDWQTTSTTTLNIAFTATPKANPKGTGDFLIYDTVAAPASL